MTIRIIAAGVVLFGCAYVGFLFATSFRKRVKQLDELSFVINQIEFDVDFLNLPIREALSRIGGMCDGEIRQVVDFVRKGLTESKCADMYGLWKRAIDRNSYGLALSESDKRIILDFAKNLGNGDRIREKNNIKAAVMRLEVAKEEARGEASVNSRMCRGLGILGGIFIVILLF